MFLVAMALATTLFGTSPHPAGAQGSSLATRIVARDELRVCIWTDYYSISWRNSRNDELPGTDRDLAQDFARRLGVRVQFVETNFRDFMDRLDDGGCDIPMFSVGITPQRAARLDFATPYLSSPV